MDSEIGMNARAVHDDTRNTSHVGVDMTSIILHTVLGRKLNIILCGTGYYW